MQSYFFRFFAPCFCVLLCLFSQNNLCAQEYFRFKSEFSIKEKTAGQAQGTLILGTVYFDKNLHKINHDIRFPTKEQWLLLDTTMYRTIGDSLVSRKTVPPLGEFSMYNMILSQQIADFGMSKSGYTLGDVEEGTDGKILSTWLPPAQFKTILGKVIIMQEQKRVAAVAFYDKDDKVFSKYYFKDYIVVNDLPVPTKLIQIMYKPEGDFTRMLEFKNITINEDTDDKKYDFPLPVLDAGK